MSIQPTGAVSAGAVARALGMTGAVSFGALRGQNQTLPSSGAVSLNTAQKVLRGVGFYNTWFTASAQLNWGAWSQTGITNNTAMTASLWVTSAGAYSGFRSLFHVTSDGGDMTVIGNRVPAMWIFNNSMKFHTRHDSTTAKDDGIGPSTLGMAADTKTHVVTTYNGSAMSFYVNGTLSDTRAMSAPPYNAPSTASVISPFSGGGIYPLVGYQLNRLWFYPYAMTAAQVATLYTAENALV